MPPKEKKGGGKKKKTGTLSRPLHTVCIIQANVVA